MWDVKQQAVVLMMVTTDVLTNTGVFYMSVLLYCLVHLCLISMCWMRLNVLQNTQRLEQAFRICVLCRVGLFIKSGCSVTVLRY